jgi:hypothetical protein
MPAYLVMEIKVPFSGNIFKKNSRERRDSFSVDSLPRKLTQKVTAPNKYWQRFLIYIPGGKINRA